VLLDERDTHGEILVVHGDARSGADAIVKSLCKTLRIPMEEHPANWKLGKGAGFIRNTEMCALGADICHAFLVPGESRGTRHCIKEARKAGIPVVEHREKAAA
jgi:hypothetical protein